MYIYALVHTTDDCHYAVVGFQMQLTVQKNCHVDCGIDGDCGTVNTEAGVHDADMIVFQKKLQNLEVFLQETMRRHLTRARAREYASLVTS